jgi:hypothetical protein
MGSYGGLVPQTHKTPAIKSLYIPIFLDNESTFGIAFYESNLSIPRRAEINGAATRGVYGGGSGGAAGAQSNYVKDHKY